MVEVIVPYAGTCEFRERAFRFVTGWHWWPVTVASCDGAWSKGAAVNPAVERSGADIIVVADADCVCEGLPQAVGAVREGAPWGIPHRKVFRLTDEGSVRFMETGEFGHPFDRRPYKGMAGGGFVVAPREILLQVPLDFRYTGWGQEDESWALALTTMVGPPWRGDADLIHLWHPPERRLSRRRGSSESWDLYERYRRAFGDREQMALLLKEAW